MGMAALLLVACSASTAHNSAINNYKQQYCRERGKSNDRRKHAGYGTNLYRRNLSAGAASGAGRGYTGFMDKLAELMAASGNEVKFQEENANGDQPTCATIINQFVSSNVDLILANATAPLQAAASATGDIPILGTSVSDYGTALDDTSMSTVTGRNISGTSDLAPLDQQAELLQEWFPDAQTVGLLYCSSEANSQYQIGVIKPILEEMGVYLRGIYVYGF